MELILGIVFGMTTYYTIIEFLNISNTLATSLGWTVGILTFCLVPTIGKWWKKNQNMKELKLQIALENIKKQNNEKINIENDTLEKNGTSDINFFKDKK